MFKTKQPRQNNYLLGAITLGIAGAVAALMTPKSRSLAKKLGSQSFGWKDNFSEGVRKWVTPEKESNLNPYLIGGILAGAIGVATGLYFSPKSKALVKDLTKRYKKLEHHIISHNSHPIMKKTVTKKRKPIASFRK
jgi:gas vesicle protein